MSLALHYGADITRKHDELRDQEFDAQRQEAGLL
jgi:hypothetical protein